MKKTAKLTKVKTKVITPRKPRVKKAKTEEKNETPSFSFNVKLFLWWTFKIVTFPLYMVYLLLFKIPTDGPAPLVGFLRFVFFVIVGINLNEHHRFDRFIENLTESYVWIPFSSTAILGIYALVMMVNLFLSFIEIWGFSSGTYWCDPFENASKNSISGYDAIEEGIDFRDTLLRAKHTPGKIEELKKTGFITKERLSGLGSSPEVNEAMMLLNSQMRAMHSPDKLKTLKNMFGGK